MQLVVGVDAGGTRTVAAASAGDQSPRTFAAGGANSNAIGLDATVDVIVEAVTGAANGDVPAAILVGAAGAGRPEIATAIAAGVRKCFPSAHVRVTHDLRIALRAVVPHGDGLVLVAGTGSAAYAEIGERAVRVGGGGYAFGDEGSGYAIGAAGLRILWRTFDGRMRTNPLSEALVAHTRVSSIEELSAFGYGSDGPVAAVASAAPAVLSCADAGERNAIKIVQTAALELFELVRAICRAADVGSRPLPLVFSGGLLRRNSLLTYLIETRIANEFPNLHLTKNGPEPYFGALALARALLYEGAPA